MVPTLHIRAHGVAQFQSRVFRGKELVGDPGIHASVEEAIRAYGCNPGMANVPGVTGFYVWYEGCTVGAVPLAQMRDEAATIAQRLIVLTSVMR